VVALKHENTKQGWLSSVKTVALKRENTHSSMSLLILTDFAQKVKNCQNETLATGKGKKTVYFIRNCPKGKKLSK